MNRLLGLFRLTSAEQRVIVIVILAVLVVAFAQKHREANAPASLSHNPSKPAASATPDRD